MPHSDADASTSPLATVTPMHPPGDPEHHQRLLSLPWAGRTPTAELFRCLARSAEVLWTRVHVTGTFGVGPDEPPITAWVERPRGLRVVDVASGATVHQTAGGNDVIDLLPRPEPHFGTHGLIDQPWPLHPSPAVPSFRDPLWQAFLLPHELADSPADVPPTRIDQVHTVLHHGREAWQATVMATPSYTPRSANSALVHHEMPTSAPVLCDAQPYTVRLDVETGICVFVALTDPAGPVVPQAACPYVDVAIHAVDDAVDFPAPDDVA